MHAALKSFYDHRGPILVKNLKARHFDAWYCSTKEEALAKALELIPEGCTVSWGGCTTAEQIGLMDAVKSGKYRTIDRHTAKTAEEGKALRRQGMLADVFITGANALSLEGIMVNIDGFGNRVAPIVYGPDTILVVAGMNKVVDSLNAALDRARLYAAPVNNQRLDNNTPCKVTGVCADCKSPECICNQVLITRLCRPAGRIKFVLIGEDLGF